MLQGNVMALIINSTFCEEILDMMELLYISHIQNVSLEELELCYINQKENL